MFHHVLTPRSKGLWLCTERLRARTAAFYDVTIAYSSTLKSISDDNCIFRGAAPTLTGTSLTLELTVLLIHCTVSILAGYSSVFEHILRSLYDYR